MVQAGYLALLVSVFLMAMLSSSTKTTAKIRTFLRRSIVRLVLTYAVLLLVFYKVLYDLQVSEWGTSINSGTALMRPFPPVRIGTTGTTSDPSITVSGGPTTIPTRNDVLIGSRYDAPFLGSYNKWLQYHPGNSFLVNTVLPNKAYAYNWYSQQQSRKSAGSSDMTQKTNSNPLFVTHVIREVIDDVRRNNGGGGRFLQQDYRTGDWRIMADYESYQVVLQEMSLFVAQPLVSQVLVRTGINYQIAHWRFGNPLNHRTYKCTLMSESSQIILSKMKLSLLGLDNNDATEQALTNINKIVYYKNGYGKLISLPSPPATSSFTVHAVVSAMDGSRPGTTGNRRHSLAKSFLSRPTRNFPIRTAVEFVHPHSKEYHYQVGSLVLYYYDKWYPGTIISIDRSMMKNDHSFNNTKGSGEELYTVSFDDGTTESKLVRRHMVPYKPITEGDVVQGCFNEVGEDLDDCYPGIVIRVMPGADIAIYYTDGTDDVEFSVPPGRYYQPILSGQ